jgi:hypothetical protein
MPNIDKNWMEEAVEILRKLGSAAYWYGEDTGDYDCDRLDVNDEITFISRLLSQAREQGREEERERVLTLIEKEAADWQKGEYQTNVAAGAIAGLRSIGTTLSTPSDVDKKEI